MTIEKGNNGIDLNNPELLLSILHILCWLQMKGFNKELYTVQTEVTEVYLTKKMKDMSDESYTSLLLQL